MISTEPRYGPLTKADSVFQWVEATDPTKTDDWFSSRAIHAAIPSMSSSYARTPSAQNGHLDNLPIDCFQALVLLLDMQSVLRLRQTNLSSRQKIDDMFEYRRIAKHALGLVDTTLEHGVAESISLSRFYYQLCNKDCNICGDSATYLDMLTWARRCGICISSILYRSITDKRQLISSLEMTEEESCRLTTLTYWGTEVVDITEVREVVGRCRFDSSYSRRTCPFPVVLDEILYEVPYLNTETDLLEKSLSCHWCWVLIKGSAHIYDREGYWEHFQQCKKAQRAWERDHGDWL